MVVVVVVVRRASRRGIVGLCSLPACLPARSPDPTDCPTCLTRAISPCVRACAHDLRRAWLIPRGVPAVRKGKVGSGWGGGSREGKAGGGGGRGGRR